ncbi:ADP-ribosylglycohydrolase family protein [Arcobacter sp. YIC-464]|uniref:ADP-ribosylglycohydrolase family protein n=1 Tax=Arcobacter sp. YIC-464 TaxID=3376631 RepID=UPI003C244A2C
MFDQKKVKELVLTSLVTDAYCLGTHWVYDEKQLADSSIDYSQLNKPLSIWHKDKQVGEFTHYGDQTYWLYEFLKDKEEFNADEFLNFWLAKMNSYNGYIDGASRNTLENIQNNVSPSGSSSTDLSIVGRIAPLLKVSKTKEEFLENVEKFVKLTHNSAKALSTAKFFARLLLKVLDKKGIEESILMIKDDFNITIQEHIKNAIASKNEETVKTIRGFGPACDIDQGFAGTLHLLLKYDNLKEMLIENAKAGGDSSARAMIASIIFMANNSINQIPQDWLAIKVVID